MSTGLAGRASNWNRPPTAVGGVASLVVSKSLDAGTTLVGLSVLQGLQEANPIARAVIRTFGVVPGLLSLSLVVVLLVTVVTEVGVVVCSRCDRSWSAVRYVGYGVPSVASVAAATHNGVVIARLCV